MLHNPDLSTHVYAVSRDWLIHFGSKPMLLHFFPGFSHVVLRFSCMSPCRKINTSNHRLLLSFVIILQSLCSPNEDFRNPKHISDRSFEHFFNGASTRFWLRLLEKVLKTTVRNVFRVSKIFVWCSRRQLISVFDKPAFSRFP